MLAEGGHKPLLMLSRTLINRALILGFMVLVGYSIGMSIQSGSILALILSITSLGAGIYFLYLLAKIREQADQEETAQ